MNPERGGAGPDCGGSSLRNACSVCAPCCALANVAVLATLPLRAERGEPIPSTLGRLRATGGGMSWTGGGGGGRSAVFVDDTLGERVRQLFRMPRLPTEPWFPFPFTPADGGGDVGGTPAAAIACARAAGWFG